MLKLALTLDAFLFLEPPLAAESTDPTEAPTDEAAAGFVEDMPDPYAVEWEPPEGPRRPPPAPLPPPSSASSNPPPSSELPPNAAVIPSSPATSVHGQRLQLSGIVFGVGGVIGLAVGAYLYNDLTQTKNELAAEQGLVAVGAGSPERVAELQSQSDKERLGMTISLVAGGSSLGLGAILFGVGTAVKKRSASSPITWLSPGPGLVGLAIRGRF